MANKKKRDYDNNYAREHYDQLRVFVKKGNKELLQRYAEAVGQSLNGYIKKAVQEKVENENGVNIDL